jgi:hypothetical protein
LQVSEPTAMAKLNSKPLVLRKLIIGIPGSLRGQQGRTECTFQASAAHL